MFDCYKTMNSQELMNSALFARVLPYFLYFSSYIT